MIGQAWALEALARGSVELERSDILEAAGEVFRLHPYEGSAGGWRCVTLDGRPTDFDRTFNHQLWFCAAGALLVDAGLDCAAPAVYDFVACLPRHMKLYPSGLIRHASAGFLALRPADRPLCMARFVRNAWYRRALLIKSIGYHAFNTHAFALIHRALPDAEIGKQRKVAAALAYLRSAEYSEKIGSSPYGFGYNPPGFEAAVTIDAFYPDCQDEVELWIRRQLGRSYDLETCELVEQVPDANTSHARLYEACPLVPDATEPGRRAYSVS